MTTLAAHNTMREISLPQGTIRYSDQGSGPTLVFLHGLLANNQVWSGVTSHLCSSYRCLALDLPLGSHEIPLHENADLTPKGVARLIADFLETLDLHDVTLIGNDTGGALSQLVIAHYPERITRLVLTNCDAFEQFFPPLVSPFHYGARFLGIQFANLLAFIVHTRWGQRQFMAALAHRELSTVELDSFFRPLLTQPLVRRDMTRFLQAVSKHYTLEAAQTFSRFHHPVLLLWGEDDPFFPRSLSTRLQNAFPNAHLTYLSNARAFVALDQPGAIAQYIREFVPIP